MLKKLFPFVLVAFIGCARVPFTQSFKNTIVKADTMAVEKVQYYIDKTIVLERTTSNQVDSFTLVSPTAFDNGIYKQVVHIRKGTKAICKNISATRQKAIVGPEPNEDLIFVNNGATYMLNAFNNKVMYAGAQYNVVKGANARLVVSKKTTQPKKSIRNAKGMKLATDKATGQ
jgi:hypothetical protein